MNQNKALGIAYKAHIGQLDKGGSPYILHPVRVALHCQTEDEKIVALLHDVVEDTSITFEDLKTEGLDDRLLEALKKRVKIIKRLLNVSLLIVWLQRLKYKTWKIIWM